MCGLSKTSSNHAISNHAICEHNCVSARVIVVCFDEIGVVAYRLLHDIGFFFPILSQLLSHFPVVYILFASCWALEVGLVEHSTIEYFCQPLITIFLVFFQELVPVTGHSSHVFTRFHTFSPLPNLSERAFRLGLVCHFSCKATHVCEHRFRRFDSVSPGCTNSVPIISGIITLATRSQSSRPKCVPANPSSCALDSIDI